MRLPEFDRLYEILLAPARRRRCATSLTWTAKSSGTARSTPRWRASTRQALGRGPRCLRTSRRSSGDAVQHQQEFSLSDLVRRLVAGDASDVSLVPQRPDLLARAYEFKRHVPESVRRTLKPPAGNVLQQMIALRWRWQRTYRDRLIHVDEPNDLASAYIETGGTAAAVDPEWNAGQLYAYLSHVRAWPDTPRPPAAS